MELKYCSIIICHYAHTDDFSGKNKPRFEMLQRCLESLRDNTDYPAEVIVVDNGGNPDDSQYLLEMARVGVINSYLRFKENMHFAFAWNQAVRIATGDYLCFTCNDIAFFPSWLSTTIKCLEDHQDRKLIATPFITPDKNRIRWNKEVLPDGCRINSLAGSNCMIMPLSTFKDIGEMPHHRIGGTIWHRRMNRLGYMVIAPPVDMVDHMAFRNGVNWKAQIKVERKLLKGELINFHYAGYQKRLYNGHQRVSGLPLVEGSVSP